VRIRLPKRTFLFRITREGRVFLLLIVVVGIVAFAKGINLIFFVFATMICFTLLSSIISTVSISNLSLARVLPTHVFAERPFPVELILTNHKRFVPAISVVVHDTRNRRKLEPKYVVKAPPRTSVSTTYQHVINRRGEYQFGELVISTSFPLGFFTRGFATKKPETLIVYPKIVPLNPNFLANVLSDIEGKLNRPGIGTEVFGFRKYQHGDDRSLEQFEELVTFAASLGSFFVEKGFKVQMLTRTGTVPFGEGNKQLLRMLTHLALIEPVEPTDETDEIYDPRKLSNSIGILIALEPVEGPLPHFAHTFYSSRREAQEQPMPALAERR